jgi:hypothetical protein
MVLSAWLPVARAHAQTVARQFVDLTYEVDPALEGCPSAEEFRTMVSRRLGYDPYRAGSALGVRVRVESAETGIAGAIDWSTTTEQPVGERHFASPGGDCRQMVATMGFVLAVQIQLMAAEPAARGATESTPAEPARRDAAAGKRSPPSTRRRIPGPPPDLDSDVAAPPTQSGRPWSAMVGAGPSVGFGLGPDPVAQGRAFLAYRLGWAALEAGVEASLPLTTRLADGGGFRHGLILGTLAACGYTGGISACGTAKLGRLQIQGMGVDRPASPAGFVALVGPRLAFWLGLGDHLGLEGHIDGLYSLTPWTVELNHMSVWTMPRLSAVAGIDLTVRVR